MMKNILKFLFGLAVIFVSILGIVSLFMWGGFAFGCIATVLIFSLLYR